MMNNNITNRQLSLSSPVFSPSCHNSELLEGVVAYVEVRTLYENRSRAIEEVLQSLGAEIRRNLNSQVTHVVFKDGKGSTLNLAKKKNIPVVNVLWIERCKQERKQVAVTEFLVVEEKDDSPFPKKRRIYRSMQPKNLDEMLADSDKRMKRKIRKQAMKQAILETPLQRDCISPDVRLYDRPISIPKTPPSMRAKRLEIEERKRRRQLNLSSGSDNSELETVGQLEVRDKKDLSGTKYSPDQDGGMDVFPVKTFSGRQFAKVFQKGTTPVKKMNVVVDDSLLSDSSVELSPLSLTNTTPKIILSAKELQELPADTSSFEQRSAGPSPATPSISVDPPFPLHNSPKTPETHRECGRTKQSIVESINESEKVLKPVHENAVVQLCRLSNCKLNDTKRTSVPASKSPVARHLSVSFFKKPRRSTRLSVSSSASTQELLPDLHKSLNEKDDVRKGETVKATWKRKPSCTKENSVVSGSIKDGDSQEKNVASAAKKRKVALLSLSQLLPESLLSPKKQHEHSLFKSVGDSGAKYPILKSEIEKCRRKSQRLSIYEFSEPTRRKSVRKLEKLVVTRLHKLEQDMVKKAVRKLGRFVICNNVEMDTTHVVAGDKGRTLNVLKAHIHGCWILSLAWVIKSIEENMWLSEESFEFTEAFPVAKGLRLERFANGFVNLDLFEESGKIFVSESCVPPAADLRDMIKMCSGEITFCHRQANLLIGTVSRPKCLVLSEKWALDSIVNNKLMAISEYIIDQPSRSPSPSY